MNTKKVIVVGATGNLGSKIAQALIQEGAEVTAMVRATSNRSKLEEMGVKNFVVGDMLDKSSLKNALSPGYSFDAIVASAAGYTGHSKGDNTDTDTTGYRNLVDATKGAGIPRFVLISILESGKAISVPQFDNKYLIEKYLQEKKQPYIALRPGAFFDWADSMIKKIKNGTVPMFFYGVDYGTIYTPDLARYAALAATSVPDSELNSFVDVGWSTPVNNDNLATAFSKVLHKPIKAKPVVPAFVFKLVAPMFGAFSHKIKDLLEMYKWVNTGVYISKDTAKQKRLFDDLPTIEEAITRYCKDKKLI
jgi:uncharacterized protein YbjT (DUF2867 family)